MKNLFIFFLMCAGIVGADPASQWRGPARTGIYPAKELLQEWPSGGPQLLWSAEGLGEGHSSVAIANGVIYLSAMTEGEGYIFAFDKDGKQIWKKPYAKEWSTSYPGSRSTPTIHDGRLYLQSGHQVVVCMDAGSGDIIWTADLAERFNAKNIRWGVAESVLIYDDKVICTPGGPAVTMAALDAKTGEPVWTCNGNGDKPAYCSPVVVKHGGLNLLLTMTEQNIIGVDADNGTFLWQYRHVTKYDINPNTPLYQNGQIFCTSGYGTGSVKLDLSADGKKVSLAWKNEELDSQFGAAVLVDGFIYGSGHQNRGWKCLDWKTGELKYSSRELGGKGNVIYADGMLYCYSERGDLGLVKPDPEQFKVVSQFEITMGSNQHWAHPVIHEGRLYVRHGDALMAYDIAR